MAYIPGPGGIASTLNISTATVVKGSGGVLFRVSVTTAGTAAGAAYDASTLAGNVAANLIGTIANAVTTQPLEFVWPCTNGILIVPPTGGVVSVSFQ